MIWSSNEVLPKTKVGGNQILNNFHSWNFSSFYMKFWVVDGQHWGVLLNHFSACVTCSRRSCHDRQPDNDDHHASAAPANLAHHSERDLITSPAPYPLPSALSSPSPLFFFLEQSRPSSSSCTCTCRPHAPTTGHHPQIATTRAFLASPAPPSPLLVQPHGS